MRLTVCSRTVPPFKAANQDVALPWNLVAKLVRLAHLTIIRTTINVDPVVPVPPPLPALQVLCV